MLFGGVANYAITSTGGGMDWNLHYKGWKDHLCNQVLFTFQKSAILMDHFRMHTHRSALGRSGTGCFLLCQQNDWIVLWFLVWLSTALKLTNWVSQLKQTLYHDCSFKEVSQLQRKPLKLKLQTRLFNIGSNVHAFPELGSYKLWIFSLVYLYV